MTARDDVLAWLASTETCLPGGFYCEHWRGSPSAERAWVREVAEYLERALAAR